MRIRLRSATFTKAWCVKVHKLLLQWLRANVTDVSIFREMLIAFDDFTRQGYFRISTSRVSACFSNSVRKELSKVLKNTCPFVKLIKAHSPGKESRTFVFCLPGTRHALPAPTDNSSDVVGPVVFAKGYLRTVRLDGFWLRRRAERWSAWCSEVGLEFVDRLCLDVLSAHIAESIETCELPCFSPNSREEARWIRRIERNLLKRLVRITGGRLYHPVVNMPKRIRRMLRIPHKGGNEPLAEVDLSACFIACLTSRLRSSPEKTRLVELLSCGRFYEFVAKVAGDDISTDAARSRLKKLFQHDCLFWKPHVPQKARRLWHALEIHFPQLSRLINATRKRADGASGLYRYLTWIESEVMFPLFRKLAEIGIPEIPLHDGVAVPQSEAKRTQRLFEEIAIDQFGFQAKITLKTFA